MSTEARAIPTAGRRPLGVARRRYGETAIAGFLFLCAVVSVVTTIGIVLSLVQPTFEFFQDVPVGEFLTGDTWAPLFADPEFGVLPLVVGTLSTTLWALVVAIPFGLGSAIYLSEYARPRVRRVVKPVLEVLAGIPTVVFGFFALSFVTPDILQHLPVIGDDVGVFSALAAGLVVGVMILPTVASLSEDALSAVPQGLREGAFALGGSKLKVSLRVVLPAALSGVVAAFVLGISRAIGETMILLIAAGGTPNLTFDPTEEVQAMTAFIASAGIGDVPTGSVGYKTIFAVGSLLFVATFLMNLLSIRLVRRFREVYE